VVVRQLECARSPWQALAVKGLDHSVLKNRRDCEFDSAMPEQWPIAPLALNVPTQLVTGSLHPLGAEFQRLVELEWVTPLHTQGVAHVWQFSVLSGLGRLGHFRRDNQAVLRVS
jgi:hypothetical protein